MGKYKFGRILASFARVAGVVLFVPALLILFTGPGLLGALPIAIQLGGLGLAISLAGAVAHAIFDASEAAQRSAPPAEPNYSLKRTNQSLRD